MKVKKENGNMNTSRNPNLNGEHLKRMPNVSPPQPPIKLDERKAKLKAKFVFLGFVVG